MKGNLKTCPNGHYYVGDMCPYCRTSQNGRTGPSTPTTGQFISPTENSSVGGGETQSYIGESNDPTWVYGPKGPSSSRPNHTVLDGIDEGVQEGKRMLVGWLISYTLDPMGVDYRIYYGKNQISRERGDIVIPARNVSAPHAEILYRNGQFAIKDLGSSNGTYVNGVDIGFDFYVLHDNDEIRLGKDEGKEGSVIFIFKAVVNSSK